MNDQETINLVANTMKFSQELMELNIKYSEQIEELRDLYTTELQVKEDYKYKIDKVVKELEKYQYYVPEDIKDEIIKFLKEELNDNNL